ncbi:hypothetical protein DSO57_1011489 [Entomophthora muscae]|uniref:Uncharacterized protein n=1 Tax=Entomophthora muscae TaxID=34485 RepID=A0ACC2RX63_9FUNG|nr:hypothetical protein DSO57_1011489 [Entomophthora muscae]
MLRGGIAYLCQHLSDQEDSSSESDDEGEEETTEVPAHEDHGFFPGLEGQPRVNCAVTIHMEAVLQPRVDLASNKDTMLRIDNVLWF